MPQKPTSYLIAALYHFAKFDNYADYKPKLEKICRDQQVKGTILLAKEGINSTMAGPESGVRAVLAYIRDIPQFHNLKHKESWADEQPFLRHKVRLKKEIVTLGAGDIDVQKFTGQHVKPQEWNQIISDPEAVVIDTRNDYEYEVGTFPGAVNPETKSFREFKDYVNQTLDPAKHKKVAMFCTGGIRCEKASAYMKQVGFDEVYQLDGGILQYFEDTQSEENLWDGECFVFDDRVTVDKSLRPGGYDMCHGCRRPITDKDKQSEYYEAGVCCPQCINEYDDDHRQRARERQKQIQLAKKRHQPHIGDGVNACSLEGHNTNK